MTHIKVLKGHELDYGHQELYVIHVITLNGTKIKLPVSEHCLGIFAHWSGCGRFVLVLNRMYRSDTNR